MGTHTSTFDGGKKAQYYYNSYPGREYKRWTGENVFNSGNLTLDLLHNFFLESGARSWMVGYLIVRGGVHQEAYAKALPALSGAGVTTLLPMPEIDSTKFPDAR
ncbi:MAG TPA: manganese catalase family protein [Rubrobacter sp.]